MAGNPRHKSGHVASIAVAVRGACAPEFGRMVEIYSQGMNPQAKRMLREKAARNQLDDLTEGVLQERRLRRAPTWPNQGAASSMLLALWLIAEFEVLWPTMQ